MFNQWTLMFRKKKLSDEFDHFRHHANKNLFKGYILFNFLIVLANIYWTLNCFE